MIRTEIYIENNKLDLLEDIATDFTYVIDDIADFGSKNTSFSKTIRLAGSATNNRIFGFVFDLNNANFTDNNLPNVNYNFNASKSAKCRIFVDNVQVFKGILRILEIKVHGAEIVYECAVFGELSGLMNSIGNARLEDLDFSAYNHTYNVANISASWDAPKGSGYYYPLIDYGEVSTNKIDFQYKAFRPALYVKEYIDKIFSMAGYTYEADIFNTDYFKRLVIPHNQKELSTIQLQQLQLNALTKTYSGNGSNIFLEFSSILLGNFSPNAGNTLYTYSSSTPITTNIQVTIGGQYSLGSTAYLKLYKNSEELGTYYIGGGYGYHYFTASITASNVTFNNGDILSVQFYMSGGGNYSLLTTNGSVLVEATTALPVPISYGENVLMANAVPKGIFQKDFLLSICKMYNLYIYDDIYNSNHVIIKPYIDFYNLDVNTFLDYSGIIDRSEEMSIKPMSELNARYYQYKFKSDNDFYNENYRKRYNEGYGDRIYDTEFEFAKETESTEVIFSASVLYRASGTDKVYPAIYKLSSNNTKEDKMDSNIRIMQVKKITGVGSWSILNGSTILGSYTSYGYAGHLDDPYNPTNDINFGVPKELQFTATTYPTTNLFNAFHSNYIAEITDKNSKLLTCKLYLKPNDIYNLDFSRLIYIDGALFRLNSIQSFNPMQYQTTTATFLKVIETTY